MKRYSYLILFFTLSYFLGTSTLLAQIHDVEGYTEVEIGPGARTISVKLRNKNGEVAKDISVVLIGNRKIVSVDFEDLATDRADDNYNGKLERDEDDTLAGSAGSRKRYARSIIETGPGIGADSVTNVEVVLDGVTSEGARLGIRFSKLTRANDHADMISFTPLGPAGSSSQLFLPPGTNRAATRLINETGDFISAIGVVLPEQPVEQIYLEAPYENSEIPLGTGRETMIFFEPPLAPFDQASLFLNLPVPQQPRGDQMQFFTMEVFPPDCPITLNSLEVTDCTPDNTYGLAIDLNLNVAARRCKEYTFTNNLNRSVNDLHAIFRGTGGDLKTTILKNAPGCGMPAVNNGDEVSNRMDIVWPAACVDPGESVRVRVCSANGTPMFDGGFWTLNGVDVGTLKAKDVSPGPEYGAGSEGLEYYLDGELIDQSPATNGTHFIENIPGGEAPATLSIVYTGPLGCEFTQTILPPNCVSEFPLDCEQMQLPDQDIPLAEYPILEVGSGAIVQFESPSSPITNFWVVPPQMLQLEDAYQCGRDYHAVMNQPQLPATSIGVTFDRSGPYLVQYNTLAGEVITEIIYVDTESTRDEFGETTCKTSRYKEIPCGDPDLAVLSSTNGSPNRWGAPGIFATSIDSAIMLICRIHEEEGDSLTLVINAHGNSGAMKIGSDSLKIDNLAEFTSAIKGKVKEVVLMSCNVAEGERGRAFVCAMEQQLGVNVVSYTGVVAVTKRGVPTWYTTGELYSWEGTTTATNDARSSSGTPPAIVYPNPFTTTVSVKVSEATLSPLRLRVFRADGSLVKEQLYQQSLADATYDIQLGDEPAGIYFLQLEMGGMTSVQRLIKTN